MRRPLRWARTRPGRPIARSRGQALVEFALVVPLFLMMLFGVVEFSLINASIGTFNFAAKDAARYGAIIGRGSAPGPTPIDTYMVNNVILPHVNGFVIAQATEVEIYQASEAGDCLGGGTFPCPHEDVWQFSGGSWTSTSNSWPASTRNDALANADYLGVRISYRYTYLTAFFAVASPTINLTATSVQRIEPQEYGKRQAPSAPVWVRMHLPGWTSALLAATAPANTSAVWDRRELDAWVGGDA